LVPQISEKQYPRNKGYLQDHASILKLEGTEFLLLAGEDDEFHGVGEVGGFELQFIVGLADLHT
jgi:hypothetical protein